MCRKDFFCDDCEAAVCQICEGVEPRQDGRDNYNREKKEKGGTATK